jgi:hypothetical protein
MEAEKVIFTKVMYPSEVGFLVNKNKDVEIDPSLMGKLKEFMQNHEKELVELKTSVGSHPIKIETIELLTEEKFLSEF